MNFDPPEEKPWGEAEWEKMMRESDVRSAKFGELLETLMDHPDRDAIISREMGWDRDEDDGGDDGEDATGGKESFADELPSFEESLGENEEVSEEEMDELLSVRQEGKEIPAYAHGYAWALNVVAAFEDNPPAEDEEIEELLGEAMGGSMAVSAKIAGGHGMGYDDDSICGNIVCCKRALEAATAGLAAFEELIPRKPEWRPRIEPLLEEGRQVRTLVEERIAELRARVWWE